MKPLPSLFIAALFAIGSVAAHAAALDRDHTTAGTAVLREPAGTATPVAPRLAGPAPVISINFSNGPTNDLAPSESAGLHTASHWNNLSSEIGTQSGLVLMDADGNPSGATLSRQFGYQNGNGGGTGTPDDRMYRAYGLIRDAEYVSVTNLPAAFTTNGYSIYVYFDINLGNPPWDMAYTVDGVTRGGMEEAGFFSGTFIEATGTTLGSRAQGNYVHFRGLTNDHFTLTGGSINSSGTPARSAVNGIQLVGYLAPPPTILSFTAAPATLEPGQATVLAWSAPGADVLTITPGVGDVTARGTNGTGSLAVTPSAATTYILTASRQGAEVQARIDVRVNTDQRPARVYLLGGQSNMQGLGVVAELGPELRSPMPRIHFWNGSHFEVLDPGTTVLGSSAAQFGPELGFARRLAATSPTNDDIYLIKYHNSGKPLDSGWNDQTWVGDPPAPGRVNFYPGETPADPNRGTLYTAMLGKYKAALASLADAATPYSINGLAWVQGEQDSKNPTSAARYATDLARLNRRLEADLDLATNSLQLAYAQVLGMPDGIAPPRFTDRLAVRHSMADADAHSGTTNAIATAHIVSTDGLNYYDDVHFNTAGLLVLGDRLARTVMLANGRTIPTDASTATINVNFAISNNDANSVNVDESAGALGTLTATSGEHWNHVILRDAAAGTPTTFTAASQGASHVTLLDGQGNAAASLTSTGDFYSNFSDATDDATALAASGEAGLVQSFVNLSDGETLSIAGLGPRFTSNGYMLVLYAEIGSFDRTMALHVTEGAGGGGVDTTVWLHSNVAVDGDADEDGRIEWVQATGARETEATPNGNLVLSPTLTAPEFAIAGSSVGGRGTLNGLRIVALPACGMVLTVK